MEFSKYKVLIVDDEPEILKALNRGLRLEKYEKIFVDSGQKAIEVFAKEEIAVIITDMRMPGMNGLELLQFINKVSPETVKIVLTGYTQLPQILVTVNKVDIYKFLTKPWNLEEELKLYIREAITLYRERKSKDTTGKSLAMKNELYQKLLSEGYEKVDHFMKLYEEILKTVNQHHKLAVEELRALSSKFDQFIDSSQASNAYEKEKLISKAIHNINLRMNYINKVFDYSKFQLRAFDLDDLADSINKIDELKIKVEILSSEKQYSYHDNFKQISGFLGEIIENVMSCDSEMERIILKSEYINEKTVIIFKMICQSNMSLRAFVENEIGFIKMIVKSLGGAAEVMQNEDKHIFSFVLKVNEKKESKEIDVE